MTTPLSPTPAALHAEVRALADRAALTDLVHRLGRWLDGRADGDPARVFTDDVRASTPGGEVRGRDAVVAQARRNHDLPTHHLIGNVLVDVEGDVAEVTANVTAHFVRTEGSAPGPTELGGRYVLGAERLDGRWLLSSVEVEPVWRVVE
ncbi:nuclear transport factor 2 family protein [Baekduia sp. Peel2402]|uniref:nuclear transport factor 2 family protein n=1 Tax=Baekduia sp. Peel2402 TaxID=3458296 RepID=UPI00403EE68E